MDAVVSNALAEVLPMAKLHGQKSTRKSIFDPFSRFLSKTKDLKDPIKAEKHPTEGSPSHNYASPSLTKG
jgi:hypothetical protein